MSGDARHPPAISVVVPVGPAHNRDEFLGACLDALSRQTLPADRFEVVVVLDGAGAPGARLPDPARTRIVALRPRAGSPAVYLRGLAAAAGDLIAFTDADCTPAPDWLERLTEGFRGERVAGCGGTIVEREGGREFENRLLDGGYILPCIGFANVVYRRSALEAVGFLDPDLCFGAEEFDFCWRLHLKGFRIEWAPEARVEHRTHRDARKYFLYGVSVRYLERKWGRLFPISPLAELRQMIEFNRRAFAARRAFALVQRIRPLAAIAGYLWARAREIAGAGPPIAAIELGDASLEPRAEIRPLAVALDGSPLAKPSHVLWWRSRQGCDVLDLASRGRFRLEGSAARIWRGIVEGESEEGIAAALATEHDVDPRAASADIGAFVRSLVSEDLLVSAR